MEGVVGGGRLVMVEMVETRSRSLHFFVFSSWLQGLTRLCWSIAYQWWRKVYSHLKLWASSYGACNSILQDFFEFRSGLKQGNTSQKKKAATSLLSKESQISKGGVCC